MAASKPVEDVQKRTVDNAPEVNQELEAAKKEIEALKAQLEAAKKPQARAKPARETDYQRVHRLETEAIAAGKDLWNEYVEVFVPHRNPTEDPFYWLSVNSRTVQFPANDTIQEMRLPFACVLVDTLANEKRAADYRDSLKVYDPKTNPQEVEDIRSGS